MSNVTVDSDSLVTEPIALDSTLKAIAAEQVKQTALMAHMADTSVQAALIEDWVELGEAIADGMGALVLPIGRSFAVPWSTYSSNGATIAEYNPRFNPVHHGQGVLADNEIINVMHAQMHHCLPFDTQFSPYQAFLYAIDGLPAGTYNVSMGFNWGSNVVNGKTYQFTLTQPLPAGGQLCGFYGAPDQSPSNWKVYAFASQTATTATETVSVAEGDSGTSLGTFTAAGVAVPASGTPASSSSVTIGNVEYAYYGLNSLHRVAYGNNRWLHSPLRKYLNSYGFNWWTPATVFDRPPAYASRNGFLSGFPEEFLSVVKPIARKTALNYVTDGGTSGAPEYDTTYDMFSLPSGLEHFLQDTTSFGGAQGKEGEPWEYWERVAGAASPLAWSSWGNTATYHPEYVQYDLASPTTPRTVWMCSAARGSGSYVAVVGSSGFCINNGAVTGDRAAPDCAIG